MNEHDYNMIIYISFTIGFITVVNWITFSLLYDIHQTAFTYMFFVLIACICFSISIIMNLKKHLYIMEMRSYIEDKENLPVREMSKGAEKK